jgi:hypothetical protein
MSTKNNQIKFNTESLLNNVNKIIQNGINDILNDYIDNYKLYEETHNYIMNLPCIKRENSRLGLNNNVVCNKTDFSGGEHDIDIVLLDKYLSDKDVSSDEETKSISTKDSEEECDDALLYMSNALLKETEKKYKTIVETRDKEIEDLKKRLQITQEQNDKRYDMFYQQKDLYEELIKKYVREIEDLKNQLKDCIKKPVICDLTADEPEKEFVEIKQEKVEEKENITLHIEEESEVEESNEEDEEDIDEEEEEEEKDDDEEDEDEEVIDEDKEVVDEDEEVVDEDEEIIDEDKEVVDKDEELVDDEDKEVVDKDEEVIDEDKEVVDKDEEVIDEDKEVVDKDEELVDDEEDDAIETENSSSDKESQKEDDEKDEDEDEEQELIEIEIDDVLYCTENEENGFIYEIDEEGNVGETVGYFKNGEPFFN